MAPRRRLKAVSRRATGRLKRRRRRRGNGDGVVRLDELIEFIKQSIADDSAHNTFKQTPSAGPIDLVPYVSPPLSEVPAARDALGMAAQ